MKKPEALAHWLREQQDGKGLCGDGAGLRFYRSLPMPHHRFAHWCTPITVADRPSHAKPLPQDSRSFGGRRFEREESALRAQWDEPWGPLGLINDKVEASIRRWKHLRARGKFVALGLSDAVLPDLIQQRLVADLQQRGRLLAVPVGFVESLADGLSFGSVLGSTSQRL